MSRPPPPSATDARLENLLDVERRLEARVRDAEKAATERVAAAREEARRDGDDTRAALADAAARDERDDLAAHATAIEQMDREADAYVARLAATPETVVERLARVAYARLIGGGASP